jgi:hypothetical protein
MKVYSISIQHFVPYTEIWTNLSMHIAVKTSNTFFFTYVWQYTVMCKMSEEG